MFAAFAAAVLVAGVMVAVPQAANAAGCANEVACENLQPGTPDEDWDLFGDGDDSIQGFATQISVNRGSTVQFKIKTDASAYTVQIFRLGYYQGNGARKITEFSPTAHLPQVQPACATDAATEIYDCGTWGVSASWAVPSTAVSGVYIARLYRADRGDSSHIPFIVRNDASHSQVVFQTSDPTWQAYNTYGQSDFYEGLANGRAYKVSYNRPFATRGSSSGRDFLFSNEYPMIRFLEANGYDLSYISGLDTDIQGSLLKNHKTFMSVGHDEYWSAGQRTNVEKARDAGVNLAFFSGNEVYWKTRWEPSEDGSNTPNRTLVCYKDTWANAKIDPVDSTATWRDPRFGDNGHGPENALTGTAYTSNFTDLAITVSAEEGKLRLWRNTPLAAANAPASTALAAHTIGYESDEDLDNGYRPAGLVRLSTTTGPTPQYLRDFGNVVTPGTTTHHLTLYKAGSGALVFGAGTIQWAWGLDTNHDGEVEAVDPRIRQATVNILADMDAVATTLVSGLTAATKTTDTTAPKATITSPTASTPLTQGAQITVSGTATDVGGQVAGVEVSLDGGVTFHPATGRGSFSYTGVVSGTGQNVVQARAIDDSANIQVPATKLATAANCPCSLFGDVVPGTPDAGDGSPVALGVKFTSSANGFISGIRFYKAAANTGTHTGSLYKGDGTVLSTATFTNETASGWQTASFPSAIAITAGATYVAAYQATVGHYSADIQYFAYRGQAAGPLSAIGGQAGTNGVYGALGGAVPTSTYQQTNYYVDVLYSATNSTPLTVINSTPAAGATSVPTSTAITATFSRDIQANTLAFTLKDPQGVAVPGTVGYDAATRTASFDPAQSLEAGIAVTAKVTASADGVGPMTTPYSWTFTPAKAPAVEGVCPCTLFDDSDIPVSPPASDTDSVELGMAFTADTDGQITGIRFYKGPGNAGAHTVSLWNSAGARLATAPVTNESTTGWQQASFTTAVNVSAGATYIASYRAPQGRYSADSGGLTQARQKGSLQSPAGAGRYTYGGSAPTSGSTANYFVDPVFMVAPGAAPEVAVIDPGDGATSARIAGPIDVSFAGPVQANTTTITVKNPSGTAVAGATANQGGAGKVRFTPTSALAAGTKYTVSVSGAKSLGGTSMAAPFTSSFTTSGVTACPCSVLPSTATPGLSDSGDGSAITIGMQFKTNVAGFITGIRYYRDASNAGTHTGALYGPDGARISTLTFSNSDPGWQTASFADPIAVTPGATYTAAAFQPNGHYSATGGFYDSPYVNSPLTGINGVYLYGSDALPTQSFGGTNYYVDVAFSTSDTSVPTVVSTTPDSSYPAPIDSSVTAKFGRPVDPSSLQFSLSGPAGAVVAGAVTYDSATNTAKFQPTSALSYATSYVASLKATSSGGVAMAQPKTWNFSTVDAPVGGETYSLFSPGDVPTVAAWDDSGPVSVGVKFSSERDGFITAVKFYAGIGNNGPQTVGIWRQDSFRLGSGTSTGSATGWRTVTLDTPVAITAGTVYVAGYTAPTGHYAVTSGGLAAGKDAVPLHIPAGGGTYAYPGGYPGNSTSVNFYVDVVFTDSAPAAPAAPAQAAVQQTVPGTEPPATPAVTSQATTQAAPTAPPTSLPSSPSDSPTTSSSTTGTTSGATP